jgi:hypothetical protein
MISDYFLIVLEGRSRLTFLKNIQTSWKFGFDGFRWCSFECTYKIQNLIFDECLVYWHHPRCSHGGSLKFVATLTCCSLDELVLLGVFPKSNLLVCRTTARWNFEKLNSLYIVTIKYQVFILHILTTYVTKRRTRYFSHSHTFCFHKGKLCEVKCTNTVEINHFDNLFSKWTMMYDVFYINLID